jgi:hypothetical protein
MTKILPSGNLDYSYWQPNTTDYHIIIREVASDNFGNCYVAGSFNGPDPALDDQPLVEPDQQGFFLAKYSRVKNIEGNVIDPEGNPFGHGYVKIYGRTLYQRSPIVDSVELSINGEFVFNDVPFGEYVLVAIPNNTADPSIITTYYHEQGSQEYWEWAEIIKVNSSTASYYCTIEMISASEFTGGSRLEGGVTELDSSDIFKSAKAIAKGKPKQKASVVLVGNKKQKSTWEVVAVVETDDEGNFTFEDVEPGTYILYVDYPGLPVEDYYTIEITEDTYISSLDYVVDEERVYPDGIPIINNLTENSIISDIIVFPNPATDYVDIILKTDQEMVIDIYDLHGKHIDHIVSDNPARIILMDLPAGTYFLRIITADSTYFEKISVN